MEIRNNSPVNPRPLPQEALQFDPTRASREAVDKFTPDPTSEVASKDEVEVSRVAQEAIAREERVETRSETEQLRIDEFKALREQGTLNTPERAERAAQQMLLDQ